MTRSLHGPLPREIACVLAHLPERVRIVWRHHQLCGAELAVHSWQRIHGDIHVSGRVGTSGHHVSGGRRRAPAAHRRVDEDSVSWRRATFGAVHGVLTNPTYAGVYGYGRSKDRAQAR